MLHFASFRWLSIVTAEGYEPTRRAKKVESLPHFESEAKKRQVRKPADSVQEKIPEQTGTQSRDQAAHQVGVNPRYVSDAKKIKGESPETFEDYCKIKWGMSRPRVYQLIWASEASKRVSTIVDKSPTTESQARPLTKLPPENKRRFANRVAIRERKRGFPG